MNQPNRSSSNSAAETPLLHCMQPVVDQLHSRATASGLTVSVDLPEQIQWHDRSVPWARLIAPLIDIVVSSTPAGGEVGIMAHQRNGFVEIEVADGNEDLQLQKSTPKDSSSSTAIQNRKTFDDQGNIVSVSLTEQRVAKLLQRFGGRLEVANCPQGGSAWTICLPKQSKNPAAKTTDREVS